MADHRRILLSVMTAGLACVPAMKSEQIEVLIPEHGTLNIIPQVTFNRWPLVQLKIFNKTGEPWRELDFRVDVGAICNGVAMQWSFPIKGYVGWSSAAIMSSNVGDSFLKLDGAVNGCKAEIIEVQILRALSANGANISPNPDPPRDFSVVLAEKIRESASVIADLAEKARNEKERQDGELAREKERQAIEQAKAEVSRNQKEAEDATVRNADRKRLARVGPDSIQGVISRLVAGGGRRQKGEFETSEHYNSAQAALLKSNDRRYTFLKDPAPGAQEFTYDADAQVMTVTLPESIATLTNEPSNSRTILIKSILTGNRTFTAKNAFNATFPVTSSRFDYFEIALTVETERRISPINTGFRVSPEKARALKPFLRFALFGRLTDAHVYIDSLDSEAKIDDPHELHISRFILLMNIESIDVVDIRSGQVVFSLWPED